MPPRKIRRDEFVRLSLLGAAALYIEGCKPGSKKASSPEASLADTSVPPSPVPEVKNTPPSFTLYKKGDAAYETLRKGFNKRIDNYPAAIALCTSEKEVCEAVQYARAQHLPVAVKSGGHSFEGFSCPEGSFVIDVSSMDTITWPDEHTIRVGPGCRLHQLYEAILPKNKILPAGSCGTVALAGLTLGGGYGLFSRRYGLTCDSLEAVTMVDGKGAPVSSADDPSLLWACKGGGNGNFGVITSFTFSLNAAPSFLQSFRFRAYKVSAARAAGILEEWFSLTSNLPLSCFSAYVLNVPSLYILLTTCEKPDAGVKALITRLSALTDKTTVGKEIALAQAVKTFYGEKEPLYFKNASAGLYDHFDNIRDCIPNVLDKVIAAKGMIYQVNTLGGKINDPASGAASAYPHRDKNYLSELQTYWKQPSQSAPLIKAFAEVQQIFSAHGIHAHYRNYPDSNLADWQHAYYGNNYPALQKIKRRYDPDNIFRYAQSIEPSAPA